MCTLAQGFEQTLKWWQILFECLAEIVSSLLKVRTQIFFASADLPQSGQVRSCLMIACWRERESESLDWTWVPD